MGDEKALQQQAADLMQSGRVANAIVQDGQDTQKPAGNRIP